MERRTSKKVRAVLAGGLVLGVGAAVTLAAWNDSESAQGSFSTGTFRLESSTNGIDYSDHDTSGGAAQLTFSSGAVSMTPGDVVRASFWVRLDAASTLDGTLTPSGVSATGGNADAISYTIVHVAAGTCADGSATGDTIASGSDLTSLTGATNVALAANNAAGTPGTPVELCLTATAAGAETFAQSDTTTATWRFTAASR